MNELPESEKDYAAEILPTEVTVQISKRLACFLVSSAEVEDRPIDFIAKRILEAWGAEQLRALQIYEEMCAGKTPERKKSEHAYKMEFAALLRGAGFYLHTEHKTGAGNADIAIFGKDRKTVVAIVEVKLSLSSWREVHQATGQAKAYAEATKAKNWFVVSVEVKDDRLRTENVLRFEGAEIHISDCIKVGAAA